MVTFCLCEDRKAEEAGLRLAICSIRRHCGDATICLYRGDPSPDFARWLRNYQVTLIPHVPAGSSSWNCKPHALLPLLQDGHREVVWLDSDVLIGRDCRSLLQEWGESELGICEEYQGALNPGSELRTRGWNLPLGRSFARTLNTAVLRVTPYHAPILERWQAMLSDSRYVPWQSRPLVERPQHCWGDQDVLNALLGSVEFANIPVNVLRTGREIIHCNSLTSFSVSERLRCLTAPIPYFIHGQGAKPWVVLDAKYRAGFPLHQRLVQELSPYRVLARKYENEMDCECEWMRVNSWLGCLLGGLGCGHYALRGLPGCISAQLVKMIR
jgi:hypothetical protein